MSEIMRKMKPCEFDRVFSIMERSFPKDEYRTYEEQKQLLQDERYSIYVAHHEAEQNHDKIDAFLAVWQFEDFTFLEHFATEPDVRGKGLGSLILQEAVQLFSNRICLEVEPPQTDPDISNPILTNDVSTNEISTNEISTNHIPNRRIAFYERNNFFLNEYPYMQPPITKGRNALPLMIMTSGTRITKERFEQIREKLYREVYQQDEILTTVYQAKETDVRNFLIRILREDTKLYSRFKLLYGQGMLTEDMESYQRQVNHIIEKYAGDKQFISYHDTFGFWQEIQEILSEDVRFMLQEGHFADAFVLVCHIFTSVAAVDMDDSDGTKGMLAVQCMDLWKEMEQHADEQLKRRMYRWFTKQLNDTASDYVEESMEQAWIQLFTGDEFINKKLAFTKRKAQEQKVDSDSWSARYHAQKWALYHIRLLEASGCAFADIVAYCKEYWEHAEVRKYFIEQCILQKKYAQAADALLESMKMDAGMPGLVRQFSTRLKEVYQMSGNTEAYKKQLWQLVTKDYAGNLEDFREIKSLYAKEDWPKVREEIFLAIPGHVHVERLYQEEKLYDRLLAYVLAQKGLYAVQQYESVLKEIYPKQLLVKYVQELGDMVQRAADRRHYQEWAAHLKRMTQIPGGQEEVQKIVAEWRVRYKNRPAMMEELKQFQDS